MQTLIKKHANTHAQTLAKNLAKNLTKNGDRGQQLHYEFIKLGSVRFKLKNKMLLILPEIYTSGIWKKYAGSIVEYAGKYGDIAKTTVIKRLRLEENLIDKPYLKAAIATAGVHKVALVAKIATPETDQSYAERINDMSKQATQALSKEVRAQQEDAQQNVAGDVLLEPQRPCKAVPTIKKLELDEEATFLFMKLKAKLGKHMSDKDFMKMLLQEKVKEEFPEKTAAESVTGDTFQKPATRYIAAAKKRKTVSQTQGKCGYPNCNNPYQVIHHPERFSQCKNHDLLVPLCKIHHEFAHNNLIQNETETTKNWKMTLITKRTSLADVLYRKYRNKALT